MGLTLMDFTSILSLERLSKISNEIASLKTLKMRTLRSRKVPNHNRNVSFAKGEKTHILRRRRDKTWIDTRKYSCNSKVTWQQSHLKAPLPLQTVLQNTA